MGALVFEPCTGPDGALDDSVALAELAALAQDVWDDAGAGGWHRAVTSPTPCDPRPCGERWTTVADIGRDLTGAHLGELGRAAGLRDRDVRRVLEEVTDAVVGVRGALAARGCSGAVSARAATAVEAATARVSRARP